jgi:D-ribose pyranase
VKKIGILNHRISEIIASMGHGDMLVIGDAGLPVPSGVERIDLAVQCGVPPILAVVEAVASELEAESILVAEELVDRNPDLAGQFAAVFGVHGYARVSHEAFKAQSARARAIVRTGECTPYANVIVVSGVTF